MSAINNLEAIFEKLSHLNHLQAITGWDEAVMMPSGGGPARAKALATLEAIKHEILTDPKTTETLQQAKEEKLSDPWQIMNLQWMEKQLINATCLPTDLVKSLTEASIQSEQAWRSMRAENNWQAFAPLLKNTFQLVKESATIRGEKFQKNAYDMLLDDYSPDLNQAYIDPIFATLKNELPHLIDNIITKQKHETVLIPQGPFTHAMQRELGLALMRAIGFDFTRGRLDVSHHPFCGGVPQDVRITTRYKTDEFLSVAMAVCHETGHAKYEQQLPEKWLDQPVGAALGMSVHESQSLLTEMQACRSQEFMHFLAPLVQQHFGEEDAFLPDNLFRLYTRVKPSLIRVDADEVTYPLHVILRYDIERALFNNEITIDDLPEAWHNNMQNYLNLSTKDNFKDGVMQDVHWPSGAFGYFPAYTFGSLIAAQLFATAKKAKPNILSEISQGDFTTLMRWLKENVHSKGSSLTMEQLLISATGQTLQPDYFLQHIKERYLG